MRRYAEDTSVPWDPIPPGALGSAPATAFEVAPYYMDEDGIPYGAWCKCSTCGWVGRSTNVFDYYGAAGEPLRCEHCVLGVPYAADILITDALEKKP